jgi:hypothetical protein
MESGQPLVMKRGRKPKVLTESSCCSPVGAVDVQSQITTPPMVIELMPLNLRFAAKLTTPTQPREAVSLEQSRMDLQRLLGGLSG